jgi:predicted HD phosphohydrolase
MNARATFVRMQDSTREDWQLIGGEFMQFATGLPERVIKHLQILEGDYGGFPIDRYSHSLQTATRALRDGRDEEYVVCALLHDIGDTLGTFNHPDIAAAILKPFVSEENHWMVQHHGIFQGHYFFTTSASTATCARTSAATRISSAPPNSASSTTTRPSMRKPRPCRSANSSRCCGV